MAKILKSFTLSGESVRHIIGYALYHSISMSLAVDRIIRMHMTGTSTLRSAIEGLNLAVQMIEEEKMMEASDYGDRKEKVKA